MAAGVISGERALRDPSEGEWIRPLLTGRAFSFDDVAVDRTAAKRSDVLVMTVMNGLKLVGVGLVLGLAIAFVLTRVMASLLFGISATDPLTFFSIAIVLLGVALVASYLPALRATKIDPMIALRTQ